MLATLIPYFDKDMKVSAYALVLRVITQGSCP